MNIIQEIIWSRVITPRDQILLLRLLDSYGLDPFESDVESMGEMMSLPKSSIYECLKRLKTAELLDTEPVYIEGSYRSLKKRTKTKYQIKIYAKKEAEQSPPEF